MDKYLEKQFPFQDFKKALDNDTTGNPFIILNTAFNYHWSFKVKSTIENVNPVVVVVEVGVPGSIREGVGIAKNADTAIAIALINVIKTFDPNYLTPKEKGTKAAPKDNTEPTTPKPEFTPPPQKPQALAPIKTDPTPPAPPKSISEEQKLKQLMDRFKITVIQATGLLSIHGKYKISKMATLLKYVQAWNPDIKDISGLTTNNIDNFITWAKKLDASFKVEEDINETSVNA